MNELAAFLGVAVLVIVTPGPDTALTIKNSLAGGRRGGVYTALGVSSGQACWTVATSVGIAALLVAFEPALVTIKLLGAAYLIFLGLQTLASVVRRRRPTGGVVPPRTLETRAAYRQGLVSNLGNPKMAAFFPALLPQFASSFLALLGLGLLFCTLTLAWLALYAAVVARAGDIFHRPLVRRAVDAVVGTVLLALGLRLAADRR